MPELRKAKKVDFESVYPLLKKLDSGKFSKERWSKLFSEYWGTTEDYIGYVLEEDKLIVGFIGLIFSTRIINEREVKFCNLSSWVVDERFHKEGLSLLIPVLKLKNEGYVITNFSSADKTYIISKKLGFLDIGIRLRYCKPDCFGMFGLSTVETDLDKIRLKLNEEDLKIFKNHLPLNCIHVLLKSEKGNCYVVLKKENSTSGFYGFWDKVFKKIFNSNIISRKFKLGRVYFVSNKELFSEKINKWIPGILLKLRIVGVVVDAGMFGNSVKYGRPFSLFAKPIYLANLTDIKGTDIDCLYSEIFILDL